MMREDNQIEQRTFDSVTPAAKKYYTASVDVTNTNRQLKKKNKQDGKVLKKVKKIIVFVMSLFIACLLLFFFYNYQKDRKKQRFIDDVIAEAEQYKETDYEYAITLYENALKTHDYSELENRLEEMKGEYREQLENEAEHYKNEKKYGDAIGKYRTLVTYFNDTSYNSEIESLIDEYVTPIIQEVEDLLYIGDTNAARDKLESATKEIGFCEKIEDENDKIDLLEVNMLDSYSISHDGDFDNCEFEESNYSISFRFYHLTIDNYMEAVYYLGGKYEALNTAINIDGMSDEVIDNKDGIVLSIYGDDELIYTSDSLSFTDDTTYAVAVHLSNLSQYEKLKFVARGNNSSDDADYYTDNGVYLIIRQPTLIKLYDGSFNSDSNDDEFISPEDCHLYNVVVNYDQDDYTTNLETVSTFENRYYHFSFYSEYDEGIYISYIIDRPGEERQSFDEPFYNGDSGSICIYWECPEEYMVYGNYFPETIKIYRNDTGEQIGLIESTLQR